MTTLAPAVEGAADPAPSPVGAAAATRRPASRGSRPRLLAAVVAALGVLAVGSLFVGVADVTPASVLADLTGSAAERRSVMVLLVSRVPRTLAVLLAGAATAVAGMLMQTLARNRFVDPSTAGTMESAVLGILVVTLVAPGAPLAVKMVAAAVFALLGTALFLRVLRAVPLRSVLVVPLIGLMLGGVVGGVTTFLAYRFDLLQSLGSWTTGDFSGVLSGRYELLWVAAALTLLAWAAADRFTLVGLGEAVSTSLGVGYRGVMNLGLVIVSLVSAVVVVVVGVIPFLGLVVPNLVSLLLGDDVRRTAGWVAVSGAGLVLVGDLLGRVVHHPYEIPVGVVVGVLGSVLFLVLLLRRGARVA